MLSRNTLILIAAGLFLTGGLGQWYFTKTRGSCRERVPGARVEIYTKSTCIFCRKAKDLLKAKNISFEEYEITNCPKIREEMIQRSNNRHTVPQIFIHGIHVGGYEDLRILDKSGKINQLLEIIK